MRRNTLCDRFCALAMFLALVSGCATWDLQKLNPENFRDPRARDIDARLSQDVPIGQNPFGTAAN